MGVVRFGCALACAALAAAASAAPAQGTARTQILFLGTAGGPPLRFDRSEPATLLIVNGREYLIDCGIGTARRLIEAGVNSSDIRTIFFTHLHADHDMGLADVMANDFFDGGGVGAAGPFHIYGPPQTKQLVDPGSSSSRLASARSPLRRPQPIGCTAMSSSIRSSFMKSAATASSSMTGTSGSPRWKIPIT